jgi:hypothetical protein
VKLKIVLLIGMAVAGVGASLALADHGRENGRNAYASTDQTCQRAHVLGTVTAPQTLTVTVTRAGGKSPFAPGQVVTVSLGTSGQEVRVNAEGCTSDPSSLTANTAVLHVVTPPATTAGADVRGKHGDEHHQSTTQTTATTTDSTVTTDTTTGGSTSSTNP